MSDKCKLCGERLGHEDDSTDTCRWCISGWKPSKEEGEQLDSPQEQDNE